MTLFTHMNPESRIWIYQSNRPFEEIELHLIKELLIEFKNEWNTHGKSLLTDFEIVYNQFIMLAVDEAEMNASGCSIDSSVRIIQDIEKKTGAVLLDRMLLAYREKDEIRLLKRSEFKQAVSNFLISETHIVFDNTIQKVSELNRWEIEMEKSWHGKAFIQKDII